MSFSVHNADLHMTNVNTTEDKRITPPPCRLDPGFTPLCGEEECMHTCLRVCAHLHVSRFVYACASVCVFESNEQRLHLVRASECASMKHFCHSELPF